MQDALVLLVEGGDVREILFVLLLQHVEAEDVAFLPHLDLAASQLRRPQQVLAGVTADFFVLEIADLADGGGVCLLTPSTPKPLHLPPQYPIQIPLFLDHLL